MSKLNEAVRHSASRISEQSPHWLVRNAPAPTLQALPEIHLSFTEQRQLQAALTPLAIRDSASGIDRMPVLQRLLENVLSAEKHQVLRDFPQSDAGALIVRGLPVDPQLPATPYDDEPGIEELPVLAGAILSVLAALGTRPVGYAGESDNTVFRHVSPKQECETEASSFGSRLGLGMHVDNPHLPLTCEPLDGLSACPEYLTLTGLRCELDVPTRIVAIRDVLDILPDFVEQELQRPNFSVRRPDSFGQEGNVLENVPLLYQPPAGGLHCRYNKAAVSATTANADFAMQLFSATANHPDVIRHILLQPGDMLIFKNQQTLHARDGFTPRYDGRDRWMIRVFGVDDPARVVPLDPNQPFIVRA
ncbi:MULTISPECIES: TauD/TfdA family dioxygenase [Pseudomonas]|uniref:Putative taurine catabolism dioxygenase n=1 Tax=Pseudomonas asplenii TaxID=53407 RepID=A0A0N0E1X9_9PSED|nr:TauD/TfdA family dioxygenase [Pseudomonas fuscovaginae]KPA88234.1 putative taurine catabolism dioxygenase [Pseudomonas fuscovaginae]KPA96642.1 putative taurine catabolism dioxygenase [Pseudomonas fuscovaginae]